MQAARAFKAALNAKSALSAAFSTSLAVADEALILVEALDARLFSVEGELTNVKGQPGAPEKPGYPVRPGWPLPGHHSRSPRPC